MTSVLLVVPCYRESTRIDSFLPGLCRSMEEMQEVEMGVLVVEDGGGAQEQSLMEEKVEGYRQQFRCLKPLLKLHQNLGKGGAVYAGWNEKADEDWEWLGFVDADGACPDYEVARLVGLACSCKQPPPAFFASRVKMLGKNVDRLWKRHLTGRVYATLVSELLRIPVYDSQCGLKLVPADAYRRVRDRLKIGGFAFDVELLTTLLDTGCKVEEVPIDWTEVAGGKVHILKDSWRMARDILKIRQNRYKKL